MSDQLVRSHHGTVRADARATRVASPGQRYLVVGNVSVST